MNPNENQGQTVSVSASDGSYIISIRERILVSYEPKEDITAYEIAKLLPLFVSREPLTEKSLAALGTAARHLTRHN